MEQNNRDSLYSVRDTSKLSNKDIILILRKRIENNIQTYFPVEGLSGEAINGKSWGGTGTGRTFRFEIASRLNKERHVLFVKLSPIFKKDNPGTLEYEALKLLHPRMSLTNGACSVARPIDYYYDLNALITESVGIRCFKEFLLKNNLKRSDAKLLSDVRLIVSGCGHWLNTFHKLTKKGLSVEFRSFEFIESFKKEYQLLKRSYLSENTIRECESLFNKLFLLDGKFGVPCAMWHCDFTPSHVFIDNNRISVIDILGIEDVPIYEDVGKWLSAMGSVNSFPLYISFDYERANGELGDIFLDAYLSQSEFDRNEFIMFANIFRLKHLIYSFSAQISRVSEKVHPVVANIFSRIRLRKIHQRNILHTLDIILSRMKLFV